MAYACYALMHPLDNHKIHNITLRIVVILKYGLFITQFFTTSRISLLRDKAQGHRLHQIRYLLPESDVSIVCDTCLYFLLPRRNEAYDAFCPRHTFLNNNT